jgi:hypothetical protein
MTEVELLQAEIKATLRELRITRDPVRRTALHEDLEDLRHELWCALKAANESRFSDWDDDTVVHRGKPNNHRHIKKSNCVKKTSKSDLDR